MTSDLTFTNFTICFNTGPVYNPLKPPALCLRPFGTDFRGGFERKLTKKWHMEVKTLKTTKSDIWCKNPSKSTTIWNQTVSAITQARNKIFEKFQNSASTSGPWLSFGFWNFLISSKFGVVAAVWKRLLKKKAFLQQLVFERSYLWLRMDFCKTLKRW